MSLKPCLRCGTLSDQSYCPSHRRGGSTRAWRRMRDAVLRRDENACTNCGRPDGLQVHHLVAKRNGGPDRMENLLTLCDSCHVELEQQQGKT